MIWTVFHWTLMQTLVLRHPRITSKRFGSWFCAIIVLLKHPRSSTISAFCLSKWVKFSRFGSFSSKLRCTIISIWLYSRFDWVLWPLRIRICSSRDFCCVLFWRFASGKSFRNSTNSHSGKNCRLCITNLSLSRFDLWVSTFAHTLDSLL